jgi:hypothetical protein
MTAEAKRPPAPKAVACLSSSSAFRLRTAGLLAVLKLRFFGLASMPSDEAGCKKALQVTARERKSTKRESIVQAVNQTSFGNPILEDRQTDAMVLGSDSD